VPVLPTIPAYKPFAVNEMLVECHLHTVEVLGSNPAVPTNYNQKLSRRFAATIRGVLRQIVGNPLFDQCNPWRQHADYTDPALSQTECVKHT
jgi:hypothetical protein